MINRSTAQSLMSDIWADSDNDNELKKAYFGDHPLHDEAVDTLWGLNWFANGHPQDDFGNPLPLDRLAPDERRTAVDGLKAVYPLRSEIDKRQGVALPWDRIAPEGAANINQARQKYLQNVDPVYSTALHERSHPAHESVKAHYGAWQDWQSGAPGPAPRWGDLDPINPYDRKAISPLRNPWSAAALTDPSDNGLLGAGLAAGKRGAAMPAAPSQPDSGGDAANGPLSPSILKALSHLFAANVAGHLGIDPPRRLAPDDTDDNASDGSLSGDAKPGGFKTLEYLPGRDGKPNLIAEPYRPGRDGPVKFRRVNDDGADGAPQSDDRERAFESAQGAQGGNQGQERYRAPANDETLPLDQRVAGFKQRALGFGATPEMAALFDVFAKVTDSKAGRRQALDLINALGSQLGLKRAGMLFSLVKDVSELAPDDPLRFYVLNYVESVLLNTVVDRSRPMPSMANQANTVLDQTYPESMVGGAYAFFHLNGGNERAFADAMTREIELARSLGLDTVPPYDDRQHRPGSTIRTATNFAGRKIADLEARRDQLLDEAAIKEKAWKENRDQAAAKYDDLPTARDPLDMIARLSGGAAGILGPDIAAGLALKTTIRTVQLARAAIAKRPAWLLRTSGSGRAPQIESLNRSTPDLSQPQNQPQNRAFGPALDDINQKAAETIDLPIGAPGKGKSFPVTQALIKSLRDDVPMTPEIRTQIKSHVGRFNSMGAGPLGEEVLDGALLDRGYVQREYKILPKPMINFADGTYTEPDRIILKPEANWQPVGKGLSVIDDHGNAYQLDYGRIEIVFDAKMGQFKDTKGQLKLQDQMEKDGFGHLYRHYRRAYRDVSDERLVEAVKAGGPNGKLPAHFDEDRLIKFIERHKPYLSSAMILALGTAIANGDIEEF